ncbi:hypothetical protein SpiGrapes_2919 [Sphaerochaeta pleomorpha str. Grapes]|uniref:Uncharacterized protein n=1 Tax=Sphaerochaeta pleomorpha (strain ATCC BAA-1885 / DSM 22778 / Grapes) TaxID=158190 RepID=G8QX84_SPHPG|nr:hypothetical protein [Sphaerochaeta pleomorpha]AEV30669.1 hypothetical protein SpiGrapes_2919 [Sphaerochaeta pleomorpha str. Grapes]
MHSKPSQYFLVCLMLSLLVSFPAFASSEDDLFFGGDAVLSSEDALFGGDSSSDLFGGDRVVEEATETDLSLSDLLLTNADGLKIGGSYSFSVTPAWFKNLETDATVKTLSSKMNSTFYFDARPDTDIRVYGKADVSYSQANGSDSLTVNLRELFSDFNIDDQIFFRVGKQTIAWGVGYFFSPADLLNVTEIDPSDPSAELEGPVAVKANMPLGVDNLYGYVILPPDGFAVTDLALAGNYEKVFGQSEVGFGAFYQDGQDPAVMVTVSSGIKDISIFGEAVTKYGDSRLYFQGTLGAQFSWSSSESDFGFSFAAQYYYNGEPTAVSSNESHYAASSVSVSLTDSLSAGLFWIGNMGDLSGWLKPSLTWKPVDYISMAFGLNYLYGGLGDQFSPIGRSISASLGFTLGGTDF